MMYTLVQAVTLLALLTPHASNALHGGEWRMGGSRQAGEAEVPLTVVQTVPGSILSESATSELAGSDPVLVVFSRPLFPLGANLGEAATQPDKAPFTLSPPVAGNWTWVSTYEARWDVAGAAWPFDQRITLSWNLALSAHDGAVLEVGRETAALRTWACGLLDVQMVSQRASEATEGLWAADWQVEAEGALEFPPDGELVVELSCPVDPEALVGDLKALRVDPVTMEVGDEEAAVTLGTRGCGELSRRAQPPLVRNPNNCFVVFLSSGDLDVGQLYAIGLPAGSSLGRGGARLARDVGVLVSGLRPFRFWTPEEPVTRFTRLELFLAHGMNGRSADDALSDLLHLRPSDPPSAAPLSVNISFPLRKQGSTSTGPIMQLRADLRPGLGYILEIKGSDAVVDMFGLPMKGLTLHFRTHPAPSVFQPLKAGYDNRANFEALTSWPVVSSGKPTGEALRFWPVSEVCQQRTVAASMYSAEALNVDGGDGDCPLLGFASAAAPASPTPPIQMATETERLLTGQQLFLSQKREVERRSSGRLDLSPDWLPERGGGEVTVVQRAWVAVSAVSAGEEVAVWATGLEGGGAVEGAEVTVYRLVNGGPMGGGDQVEAVRTGVTDTDGLAVFSFPPDDALYSRPGHGRLTVALASHSPAGPALFLLDKVQPPSPTPALHTTAALMFGRSAVAPGDTLHIKGWVRQLQSDEEAPRWAAPLSGRFELWLRVKTQFGTVMTFHPPMGSPVRLPVSPDAEVGGFEAAVEVPLDVDVAVEAASFELMWAPSDSAVLRKVRLSSGGDPSVAIRPPYSASSADERVGARAGVLDALNGITAGARIATAMSWPSNDGSFFPDILELRTSVARPLPGQPFGVAVCIARDSDGRVQSQLSCAAPTAPLFVVVTLESQDGGPLSSCRLRVGMDVEAAFNGCRFQLEAGAPKSGLQLTACPAQPRGSAGRKLRMGRASWEGDDDGDEIECESLQLFPLTTPATGAILKAMPGPEVGVVQRQASYTVGDEVVLAVENPSKGARALLRWGYGSRFRSLAAPLRQGFSLLNFTLGPECALGVCDFYLTVHTPRQDLTDGGWAGPALPRSKLLDPLAPYTVHSVLRIPVAPIPPATALCPHLQLLLRSGKPLSREGDTENSVSAASVESEITVQVGVDSEHEEAVEVLVVVVEVGVAPQVPDGLGALVASDLPTMCPQRSCMTSSNAHLVAANAANTALEATLGYMSVEPWIDPTATSDAVQGSLLSLFPAPQSHAADAAKDFHTAVDLSPEDFLGQFKDCLTYFPIAYDGVDCLPGPLRLRSASTSRPPPDQQPSARVPQARKSTVIADSSTSNTAVALSPAERSFAQNMTLALAAGERIEQAVSEGRSSRKKQNEDEARFSLDVDPTTDAEPLLAQTKRTKRPRPLTTSDGDDRASSTGGGAVVVDVPLLTFQVVRIARGAAGPIAVVPLSLPTTPGEYKVIAVAAIACGAFGSTEMPLRVKPAGVWLQPLLPPVVHAGDVFFLRLRVQAPNDDPLLVQVGVLEGGLELLTPGSTLLHPKSGAGEAVVRVKAVRGGVAAVRVAAAGADPLRVSINVRPVSDPIQLFESFTISGSSRRQTEVELDPQWMAPEGNLSVSVAADHLPVVLNLAEEALRGYAPASQLSSERLLARVAAAAVLHAYAATRPTPGDGQLSVVERAAAAAAKEATAELQRRSVDCCGLLPSASAPLRPDIQLNAWALWLLRQLRQLPGDGRRDELLPPATTAVWRKALTRAAARRVGAAEGASVPLDVMLAVRTGMAPDWGLPVCGDEATRGADAECVSAAAAAVVAGRGVEGGEAWESRPGAWAGRPESRLGLLGLLDAGLAAVEAPVEGHDAALLSHVLREIGDAMRLRSSATGGYLAAQDGSPNALNGEGLSLSLLLASRVQQQQQQQRGGGNDAGQLAEWLAEAVVQRADEADVREAFLLPSPPPPPREVAAALLALHAYDDTLAGRVWADSDAPRPHSSALSLQLDGQSEETLLWESGDGVREVSVGVEHRSRLNFHMRGPARVVVALRLRLFPTAPPLKPLNRGVLVTAAWLDGDGNSLDALCLGQAARLAVTLSVRDPLQSVEVVIPLPGGMVATGAHDSAAGGVTATCGPSTRHALSDVYACPDVTARPSTVIVRYATLPRGTSELAVDALATHVGQFVSPPVVATAVNDASVGGASAAAAVAVREECQ